MDKVINLSPDSLNTLDSLSKKIITEKLSGGVKGTMIRLTDHDTGEVLGEYQNKIIITGSLFNACSAFNVYPSIKIPDYNTEMKLQNSYNYDRMEPKNPRFVCLFCADDSGCGTAAKDVFVADYTDRIQPVTEFDGTQFDSTHIFPFRYVDKENDLNDDLRKYYFGRKEFTDSQNKDKVAYYFKSFDADPQLHLRYTDGTQINEELFNIKTQQAAECYVETRLRISRQDFRDYFEQVLGWDNARISCISLCFAWVDDTIDEYKWYQQIVPYSKLNFSFEQLIDLTRAIDFQYCVYY